MNLYGSAIGRDEAVPKEERHDHLSGPKGVFNGRALAADTVVFTEGGFDALSLPAEGYDNAYAIFGTSLPWDWVRAERVVFGFDQDAGGATWQALAWEGVLRGKAVF